MTTPTSAPVPHGLPIADSGLEISDEEREQAGRALGFFHAVGLPIFCVLMVAICFGIFWCLFDGDPDMGPFFVAIIGAFLISLVVSMVLWRHAYVPLVDVIWEACGGQMVPYKLSQSYRTQHRYAGSSISDHSWGENAAILFWVGLALLAGAVSQLKAALAKDRLARGPGRH